MIVDHVAITTCEDYVTRREPYRHAHLERLVGLRSAGIVIGGGPAPDGKTVDLFYRLRQATDLDRLIHEDPYWVSGAWTGHVARSFSEFVEPWEAPPVVLDGSRRVTIVEGIATEPDMAQFALIELRGAGRMAFGGRFESGATLALVRTADAREALGWFTATGFWAADTLTARSLCHVL